MTARAQRFAIATDGTVTLWQARCVEALAATPGVTIERWVRWPGTHADRRPAAGVGPLAAAPVPEALRDLDAAGANAEHVHGDPSARVDVLLDLTVGLPDPLAWATESWHFGYGEALSRDPERAALVDYISTPGRSRVALVAEPGGRIVRAGRLVWWRGEQLQRLLLDPADWPAAAALDLADPPDGDGPIGVTSEPAGGRSGPARRTGGDRLARLPRPILEVAAMGRRMVRAPEALLRNDDWNVGVVDAPIGRFLSGDHDRATTWLPRRPGHFAADPFGLERAGILHIVFEDFDQRRGRGSIAHVAIAQDGSPSEVEIVLDPGVHASYPFLVEHAGSVFMLPETSAAGELALYEAVAFPTRWRKAATLLPGVPAVDATVVEHEGRWWMFATRLDRGPNHNLFIWHAPALTGPWTAHRANPVKTDARSARPGGTPFVLDGQLYRPAQDDSSVYGGGLVLNRIDVLTPRQFMEVPVKDVKPEPGSRYSDGLHTISKAGSRTLIDGNVRHLVPETLGLAVMRRFGRPGRAGTDSAG